MARILIGVIGVLCTLWMFHGQPVQAAGPQKPQVMTQGSADISKVDKATTKAINYILYFAYAAGAITLAIGTVLLTPVIGKTEEGQKTIKGGVLVIFIAGFFHVLLGMYGSLFT